MTIKASLVSLQGCTVNSIDRKQRHKHTDRHRAIDSSALMLSSHFQTWPAQAFPPHMDYDPAGPLCPPPSVPQQAVHFASVSPTQHDTKLQSAASALTAQAHVFLLSWTGWKREEGRGNEGRRERRGVKGSRGERYIFLWSVLITSSQPGGEDSATRHSEILKTTPVPGEKKF